MQRRDAVLRAMKDHPISQRRACVLIGVDPKTVRRDRPPDNPEIREADAYDRREAPPLRVSARRHHLGAQGHDHERKEALPHLPGRGPVGAPPSWPQTGARQPNPDAGAAGPTQRWSLDFLSDTFGACRKFRILAVNDDCCRENLALIAETSMSGARVARELDSMVRIDGKPACIVSDSGTEFTSKAILKWANENGVEWHYIEPGKPQQNG
jgi:putative transposase